MRKWFVGAGLVVVLGLLALLLYEVRKPADAATTAEATSAAGATVSPETSTRPAPKLAPVVAEADKPKKLDPKSDKFMYRFDEILPGKVTKEAAKCYHRANGKKERRQKLTLEYVAKVKDGEVTITNVTVKDSTLNDAPLEKCMLEKVAGTHWHDDLLPDYEFPDLVVMRPEMGMKKFIDDDKNVDVDSGPLGHGTAHPTAMLGHEDGD